MSNNYNITYTPNIEDEILTSNPYIKVKTPNLYYSKREKLEDQLIQFNLYFYFRPLVKDKDKGILAILYLRGKVAKQIKPTLTKYLKEENNKGNIINLFFKDFKVF